MATRTKYDSGVGAPRDGAETESGIGARLKAAMRKRRTAWAASIKPNRRYSEAVGWYQKAADQGDAVALNNLA